MFSESNFSFFLVLILFVAMDTLIESLLLQAFDVQEHKQDLDQQSRGIKSEHLHL